MDLTDIMQFTWEMDDTNQTKKDTAEEREALLQKIKQREAQLNGKSK